MTNHKTLPPRCETCGVALEFEGTERGQGGEVIEFWYCAKRKVTRLY